MGDSKFRREYLAQAYNLLENLNMTGYVGNNYLLPKVIDGSITLKKLVTMTDEELYPPKWQKLRDKRLKEIKNENNAKVATTDLYKCNKCHKRECTYFQLQTRSQDEPMTTFITCNNCGTRWKE
jgi:transcription elongation factor S-II